MKEGSLHLLIGLILKVEDSARNGICWQLKGYLYCMFDIYSKVECSLWIQVNHNLSVYTLTERVTKKSLNKQTKKELCLEGEEPNPSAL